MARRDAVFEHGDGGIAVAGIDVFIGAGLLKPRFGGLGVVINKALGQKDCLADLIIIAAAATSVHQFCAGVPFVFHVCLRADLPKIKSPIAVKRKRAFILTF